MTVMFLILVGLFLTFAAFALDLGNLYLWQLRLDKAARAGALAGIGYRGLHGYTAASTDFGQGITDAAKSAVRDNLKTHGLFSGTPTEEDGKFAISPTYDPNNDSLKVEVTYHIPTILVGKLSNVLGFGFNSDPTQSSGGPERILHTRAHTAALSAANVVLLLDVSGSMLCPITTNCACRRNNTCPEGEDTKLSRLVTGVQTFAQFFNPQRDRISVIAFNLAARRLFSFTDNVPNNPQPLLLSSATLLDAITDPSGSTNVPQPTTAQEFFSNPATLGDGLTALAGSNTNHCDALAEGIFELENLSTALYGPPGAGEPADRRQLQPFVVLFTDGAPNAMRGIFNADEINPNGCDRYNNGNRESEACPNSTDFYHYALEWVAGQPNGQPLTYRGPGPFVQRAISGGTTSQPTLFQFPIAAGSVAPNNSITCGVETSDPRRFEQTITTINQVAPPRSQRGNINTGCLTPQNPNTFQFSIPNTNPDGAGNVGNRSTANYLAGVSNVTMSSDDWPTPDQNWPPAFFPPSVRAWGYQRYDQLPYYCAIEAADYIRTRFAGTFYVIGLGPTASMLRTDLGSGARIFCDDPLQDADDHVGRKDWFLSRLAFSRNIASNPTTPTDVQALYQFSLNAPTEVSNTSVRGCNAHRFNINAFTAVAPAPQPRFPLTWGYTSTSPSPRVDGPTTYQDLRPFRPKVMDGLHENERGPQYRRLDTQGEYFPTSNANEVPNIFGIIAKAILLRATS